MADHEDALYSGRRDDSPVDHDSRNEREGSRESDHDDRDQRRRGGGYERDLRRENPASLLTHRRMKGQVREDNLVAEGKNAVFTSGTFRTL